MKEVKDYLRFTDLEKVLLNNMVPTYWKQINTF